MLRELNCVVSDAGPMFVAAVRCGKSGERLVLWAGSDRRRALEVANFARGRLQRKPKEMRTYFSVVEVLEYRLVQSPKRKPGKKAKRKAVRK